MNHDSVKRTMMIYQESQVRIACIALTLLALLNVHAFTGSVFAQNSVMNDGEKPNKLVYVSQSYIHISAREEYVPTVDSIRMATHYVESAGDSLNPSTILIIRTRPSGAQVFIDSNYVGVSPISLNDIVAGQHRVQCTLKDFRELSTKYDVENGIRQTLIITFIPEFGVLSLTAKPEDAVVTIDSTRATYSPLADVQLPVGTHSVSISHPLYDQPISGSVRIYPGYRTTVEAGEKHFSEGTLLGSLVLPGLGQLLDRNYLKGSLECLFALGSAYFVYDASSFRNQKQSAFEQAKTQYNIASNETEAIIARTNMMLAASDLDRANNRLTTSYWLLGTAYVVSLADALLFHTFRRELVVVGNYRLNLSDLMEYHRNGTVNLGVTIHF